MRACAHCLGRVLTRIMQTRRGLMCTSRRQESSQTRPVRLLSDTSAQARTLAYAPTVLKATVRFQTGVSALMLAARRGHDPCVHALLEAGADKDRANKARTNEHVALLTIFPRSCRLFSGFHHLSADFAFT